LEKFFAPLYYSGFSEIDKSFIDPDCEFYSILGQIWT